MKALFKAIIFLILVFVLVSCSNTKESSTNKEAPQQKINVQPETKRSIAEKPLDPQTLSDVEIMKKAISSKDAGICDTIKNQNLVQGCKDRVEKAKAISLARPELCDAIINPSLKEDCINLANEAKAKSEQASPQPEQGRCDSISDEGERSACIFAETVSEATNAQSPELCNKLGTDSSRCRDTVIKNMAIKSLNPAQCDSINYEITRLLCKSDALNNKARAENNPSLCNEIPAEDIRQNCIKSFE